MPRLAHPSATQDSKTTPLGLALEGVLITLLAFLPFAFGGVWPLSQLVLVAGVSFACLLFGLRCLIEPRLELVWTWAFGAALIFVGIAGLQLLPLPLGLLKSLSPQAAEAWREAGITERGALSLYPHATRIDLRLAACAMAMLALAAQVFRSTPALRRLLWSVTAVGAALTLTNLVHWGLGIDKIYGLWEASYSKLPGGTFVHPGHMSQFLNLCIGSAIGLILMRAREREGPGQLDVGDLIAGSGRGLPWTERLLASFLAVAALCIFLSASRNGVISMVFAGSVCALVLQKRQALHGIGWATVGVLLAAFVGLLVLGFDPVFDKFSQIGDHVSADSVRFELLRDTLGMWMAFPLLGAGLGTYGVTFPPFDQSERSDFAQHAENQYAEFLAETGVLGMAALLALMVWTMVSFARSTRDTVDSGGLARFGLGFGLLAVAFHGLTDFGIKTPAITVPSMLFAGALIGSTAKGIGSGRGTRAAAGLASLVIGVLILGTTPEAYRHWKAELHWDVVSSIDDEIPRPHFRTTEEQFERLLAHAQRAVELQPGDVVKRHETLVFEWHAADAAADDYETDRDLIRSLRSPELVETAAQLAEQLLAARVYAPWYGPLYSAAGQLRVLWLDDERGAAEIQRGTELASYRPESWLAQGTQLLREGRGDEALEAYRRGIRVGGRPGEMLDALVVEHNRPDLALEFAGHDVGLLTTLEGRVRKYVPDATGLLAEVEGRIFDAIELAVQEGQTAGWMLQRLAVTCAARGETDEAIGYWRSFLLRDPRSTHRYELAVLLEKAGDEQEARRQLRSLIEVHPKHRSGKALLNKLLGNDD